MLDKSEAFGCYSKRTLYNKALINRGSITFWLDDEAI
ncbi:hypothetical protein ACTXQV_35315, partial [Klebsiella pneumoniae]